MKYKLYIYIDNFIHESDDCMSVINLSKYNIDSIISISNFVGDDNLYFSYRLDTGMLSVLNDDIMYSDTLGIEVFSKFMDRENKLHFLLD